jgi:hypothetical protein
MVKPVEGEALPCSFTLPPEFWGCAVLEGTHLAAVVVEREDAEELGAERLEVREISDPATAPLLRYTFPEGAPLYEADE